MRFEVRPNPSRAMLVLSPLISLSLTSLVAMTIFAAAGLNPLDALVTFLTAPLADLYGLGELLIKAAPLVLIGIGLAIGFRAGVWNIGAEGQLTVGVIFAGYVALKHGPGGSAWVLPAMLLAGAVGGMIWAGIPAALRIRFNASEILVSLMLNYVAALWLSFLIFGPWRDPAGFNFPQSEPLAPAALFPILIEDTRANISVLFALVAVAAGWLFMTRSFTGFQLKVTGLSQGAARYAGFSLSKPVWIGMLAGGAAAGVAGVGEIAGPLGQIFPTASPGYGYAAIIVAYLGRLHPLGILLSGLLMALLYLSGDLAQMSLGMPSSITGLLQSTLLFFLLTTDVFIHYRIRFHTTKRAAATKPKGAA